MTHDVPCPEIRAWARREAAKLPAFTLAEIRQLALITRRIDARRADVAA